MKKTLTIIIIFAFGVLLAAPPSEAFFLNNLPSDLYAEELSTESEPPLECEEEEGNFNQGLDEEERHLSFGFNDVFSVESYFELLAFNLPFYKEFIPGIIVPPPELV